ncbi:MAG: hypothetical protein WCD11_17550 [Solirubrobacteraceae bacterium]
MALEPVRDLIEDFMLDPRLGDPDLYLRDAQAMRRDRRRVLARLPHNQQRLPGAAQTHGRVEHGFGAVTREQLAIHEARDLLRRPRSHPLPELVDQTPRRLAADPENNPSVGSSVGKCRRDEDEGVMSETIKGPSSRDHGREMAKSTE